MDPKHGSAQYWHQQIIKAKEWKNTHSTAQRWGEFWNYFEHRVAEPQVPQFNLIYMLGSALIPQLVFQRPHAINQARLPEFNVWAQVFDSIDNWLIEKMGVQALIEQAIIQAYITNLSAFIPGFDLYPEDYPLAKQKLDPFPRVRGQLNVNRRYNMPFIELVPTENLILPPRVRDVRNFPWFAYQCCVPTRVLKQHGSLIKSRIQATHSDFEFGADANPSDESTMQSFYVLHDTETQKVMWITKGGEFLYAPEEDPVAELFGGPPIEIIQFNPGKYIWGSPDVAYIESQYLEGNETRQDGRLQRKSALSRLVLDAGVFDADNIDRILTSAAGGIVLAQVPSGKSLKDAIIPLQPHVQREYFEYNEKLLNDAQLLTNLGPNQLGTFAPGRRTAKEARVVEQQHTLRIARRRHDIASAIGNILSLSNKLVARYWKSTPVYRVLGVDGAMYWVSTNAADFAAVPDRLISKVSVDSLAPTTRDERRDEMVEVLNALASVPEGAGMMFPIVRQLLSTFDWFTVENSLPMGNQGMQMTQDQFASQQQQLQANPKQLNQATAANLGMAQPMLLANLPESSNERQPAGDRRGRR